MNVLIDLTYIDPNNPTGVSVYAERLISGLQLNSEINVHVLCTHGNQSYIKTVFPSLLFHEFVNPLKGANPLNVYRRNTYGAKLTTLCKKHNIQIFFLPFLTLWSAIPQGSKVVAVVHDTQPLSLNSKLKNYFYRRVLKHNLEKCDKIVNISNYVKDDLGKIYPSLVDRQVTIYNSIEYVAPTSFESCVFKNKYILNVNAMIAYKNQFTLLKAFNLIKDKTSHNLVFKGGNNDYWRTEMLPYIKLNKLEDRVFLVDNKLSKSELAYLYHNADVFVNPSLMEGFGFTPIEAAIQETTVLTTSVTSLKETTMGLLNYIDNPMDDTEYADKILNIIETKTSQNNLSQVRDCLLSKYSIENQVNDFVKLFVEICA